MTRDCGGSARDLPIYCTRQIYLENQVLLQAIHPSTAKLIRRLADMTANRQLDWQEADQNGVQLAVADYLVAIRLDPVSLVITTIAGEELERVDSDQLQAMSAPDFESYAHLLTMLHSNALRAARKVESAVQDMLEELEADETLDTSSEATRVTIEPESDEQNEHEVPFVLGGLADLEPKASETATAEPFSDLDDSSPMSEAAWPSDDPFSNDADKDLGASRLPDLDDWGTSEPETAAEAPLSETNDSPLGADAAWPSDDPFAADADADWGMPAVDEAPEAEPLEPPEEAAKREILAERVEAPVAGKSQADETEESSFEIPVFLRRQADAGSAAEAAEDAVASEDSDQGFDVVEHLERFEDDPFGVNRGPAAGAEAPAGVSPTLGTDAVESAPPAPDAESPSTDALSIEEMQWVQNQTAEPVSSVVFGGSGLAAPEQRDDVECSVFAPRSSSAGKLVQIQVFLHTLNTEQRQAAELTAEKIDSLAALRSRKALSLSLAHGTPVQILLTADDSETRQSFDLASPLSEQTVWHGTPTSVSFFCRVDGFASLRNHLLKCLVSVEGVPVGEFRFTVEVTPMVAADDTAGADLTEPDAEKYQSVFLSYAREDKDEVDRVARVYNTMGLTVHRDIASLQPGEVFEGRLMAMLRNSDAFVLIWSQNAQNSEAVRQEVKEALRVEENGGKPRFLPFPIEGPPIPMPWPEFADRHIGDPIYHRG